MTADFNGSVTTSTHPTRSEPWRKTALNLAAVSSIMAMVMSSSNSDADFLRNPPLTGLLVVKFTRYGSAATNICLLKQIDALKTA